MTDRGDRPVDRDDPDEDAPRSLIRSLLALLREMDERGERKRSDGSHRGPRTPGDYSISIGDPIGSGRTDPPWAGTGRADVERASPGGPEPDYHVATRETDGGVVVVADLPRVGPGDVDAHVDPDDPALVVDVAGTEAARHPLESGAWTLLDRRFANGVLEVELRRG